MPRIQPVDQNTADPATAELLNSVRKSRGTVPNLLATMANSPAVATAYLASWPMPMWIYSAGPATLRAKSARSWPTWR